MVSHLASEDTSVCYVAPTRSLCREVERSLEKRLRCLGKRVVSGLPEGDWFGIIPDLNPEVEVMTPERLSYLLRADSDGLLQKFGMFIFDEVHTIGEPGRGWILEEDLAYLQYATEGTSHRMAFLSAAVGNKVQFMEWIGNANSEVIHLSSEWRGPRRLYAIWHTEPDWSQETREAASPHAHFAKRGFIPLYGRLDTLVPHSNQLRSLKTREPIGRLVLQLDAQDHSLGRDYEKSTPMYQMLVPLVAHFGAQRPRASGRVHGAGSHQAGKIDCRRR